MHPSHVHSQFVLLHDSFGWKGTGLNYPPKSEWNWPRIPSLALLQSASDEAQFPRDLYR